MNRAMEALTGRVVKRYRIYERLLAPDAVPAFPSPAAPSPHCRGYRGGYAQCAARTLTLGRVSRFPTQGHLGAREAPAPSRRLHLAPRGVVGKQLV